MGYFIREELSVEIAGPEADQSTAAALLMLATRLANADETKELFDLVAGSVVDVLPATRVSIGLFDREEPEFFQVVALRGSDGSMVTGDRLRVDETLVGLTVDAGLTCVWPTAERVETDAVALQSMGVGVAVNAPLTSGDRCFGTLNAGYDDIDAVRDNDVAIFGSLAQLLASQMERIESRAERDREISARVEQTDRLARLHNLEAQLLRTATAKDAEAVLLENIGGLVDVDRVSLAWLVPGRDESVVNSVLGINALPSGATIVSDRRELVARFATDHSFYTADHSETDEPVHVQLSKAGLHSSMNLGVFVNDELIGTLNVGSRQVDGLTAGDQAILQTLASFLGSTLERIEAHGQIAHEAHHDQLTGLIRRSIFDAELAAEIEAQRLSGIAQSAVCFLDIDRFKLVNDTTGHLAGDRVLRDAAERFTNCLGPVDTLSRVGGDEFVMILRGRDRAGYLDVAEQIVAEFSRIPFRSDDRSISSSVSVGLAYIGGDSVTGHEVVAAADAACYVAKAHGGSRVSIASDTDEEQNIRRTAGVTLHTLREAIAEDRLVLYGQPIRPLGPDGVVAVEALVRMPDELGRMTPPSRFIPIAEAYGSITELDAWVVSKALSALARAKHSGAGDLMMFVNLSPTSISSSGFCNRVAGLVIDSGVVPSQVCFEITETGTMQNFDAALGFVAQLREMGVKFALDDFGVGLSSLSQLQKLPVDFLKIDGSLIRDIDSSAANRTMVASIKAMADGLGISTVAEFIESDRILEVVTELGIQSAQGYFLGHPARLEVALGIAPAEPG